MNNKKDLVSKIISVLFHPLLMPTYALLIIFNSGTHYAYLPPDAKLYVYLLVIISTFVLPVGIIPFLINLKVVKDFSIEKGRERFVPLFVSTLSYVFSYQVLHKISYSTISFIEMMMLAASVLVFISLLVSLKWKISVHLVGIGGLFGALLFYALFFVANFTYILIFITIIAGIVSYARLQLNAHKPSQVYTGFLTGLAGMLLILYLVM